MTLPRRAQLVVSLAFVAGLCTVGVAAADAVRQPRPSFDTAVGVTLFTALVLTSWLWPLVMYRNSQSEAVHLDEGFFVIMALVLPAAWTILAFALATLTAQTIRRRPLVKSVFNFGQVVTAVGLGLAASRALAAPTPSLNIAELGGALVGAIVFFVVNSGALAAVLVATGTPWRKSILDGVEIRVLLVAAGVAVGLMTALAVSGYRWSLPLAVIPLLILRQVLAGHFQARHDRTRLSGLFEATLEANRSLGDGDVIAPILESARLLLRCSQASVTAEPPVEGELAARFPRDGAPKWLVVSGRSRGEPFDSADSALLDALAAVAAGALTNADLYHEGRHQRERLSAITSSLGEGVCALDGSGRLTFLNPAAARMLGRRPSAVPEPDAAPDFLVQPALRAMATGNTIRNDDTTFQRPDGTSLPVAFTASPIVDDDEAVGAVIAFRDITERKAFEEELARHAFHDALTGLANRRRFLDHLDHALDRSLRSNERHAVVYADVDRFKIINDSLGHHAGDELVIAIARRIQAALRPGDMLARFGGDEFTLLLEGVAGAGDAVAVVHRILDRLRDPIQLPGGHEVVVTISIGIAVTGDGKTRDDILRDADVAMYEAKAKGRCGRYEIFDSAAMGARSAERLDLEAALRRGLDRDELEIVYQPIWSIADRRPIGVEALVRWRHPVRGLLGPEHFIGLAEDTGLILPIGRMVLDQACRQARQWRSDFGEPLSMCVNLSPRQFQQIALSEEIEQILWATGVDPQQICLEITETLAMEDVERTSAVLRRLKELGVRLAIDDFGTGYSSLGYLKSFPVDVVKIDRSFVDGLDTNPVDSAIVGAVIGLASAVGMTTVAEGVETLAQMAHLESLGCPAVQGFYLSRPVSAEDMGLLLKSWFGKPERHLRALAGVPSLERAV
jgi:diguanylate cyclase (GGDEF)-like protein/PAS domain S-box-containing protein